MHLLPALLSGALAADCPTVERVPVHSSPELRVPPSAWTWDPEWERREVRCPVEVELDATGAPVAVEARGCPGPFGEHSADALRKWRWEPVYSEGVPSCASTTVTLTYRWPRTPPDVAEAADRRAWGTSSPATVLGVGALVESPPAVTPALSVAPEVTVEVRPSGRLLPVASERLVIESLAPEYPPMALRLGVDDAWCILEVTVDRSGRPTAAAPEVCTYLFQDGSVEALLDWRFGPLSDKRRSAREDFLVALHYVPE